MARRINILTADIYNKIAAGEVVEKPASALKEIVENSIDAGARRIAIEIEQGGLGLIAVSDNGCGIYEEDLDAVFLKHATSKLSSVNDLESIQTLGFRGEALSSIAAVSRVTLTTRTSQAETGVKICVEEGKIVSKEYVPFNVGTKIEIRDLFFNVPARKKFLKSPSRESAEITKYVARLILTNPNLSMSYDLDGKTVYQTKGNDLSEAIFVIYGEKCLENCLPINVGNGFLRIMGYVSIPEYVKSNTTYQTLSVNGRCIEDKTLQSAIMQAYRPFYVGNGRQYPMYILNLDIPCDLVDVNVHPRKSEVRFQNAHSVAGKFYHAVEDVLKQYSDSRSQNVYADAFVSDIEEPSVVQNDLQPGFKPKGKLFENAEDLTHEQMQDIWAIEEQTAAQSKPTLEEFADQLEKTLTAQSARRAIGLEDENGVRQPLAALEIKPLQPENTERDIADELLAKTRILGAAFKTYLILEKDDKIIFVDQHAAHERILFDKFMQNKPKTMQSLLFPYVFSVNETEADFIENNLENIANAGIEIEPFGKNTFRICAVSTLLNGADMEKFVQYMLSGLEDYRLDDSALIVEALAKKACKAAVKAGYVMSEQEIKYILKMMYENKVVRCPHGRPVTVVFTKAQFEKMFMRTL